MSELLWKLRYAWQVKRRCGWRMLKFGWYCATQALIEDCDSTVDPIEAADVEMSYWGE